MNAVALVEARATFDCPYGGLDQVNCGVIQRRAKRAAARGSGSNAKMR
jgi:hypothetical protein